MNRSRTLSRRELYDLVWAEPLRTLAKRLDISDRGLAKKCDAHNVPRPPQGHWTRLECGLEVEQTPLPNPEDAETETIEFYSQPKQLDEKDHKAKCLLTEDQLAHAMSYRIPERVTRYCEPIRACRNAYKESKSVDNYGRVVFRRDIANPGFKVTPKTFDRASLFFHGLIKLCQDLGWTFEEISNWQGSRAILAICHADESMQFQLKEPVKQVERDRDSSEFLTRTDRYWYHRYEYRPTGLLEFSIEGLYSSDIKTRWKDKGGVLIETQLLEMVQSLSRGFEYRRLQTIEREHQQRQREIEQAKRKELQRLQKIEDTRREHLFSLSEDLRKANGVRALIDGLRDTLGEGDQPLAEWLTWAEQVASEIDPLGNADGILERYESLGSKGHYDW